MTSVPEVTTGDPALFAGTAPYYARYRPDYPEPVFSVLTDAFGLGPGTDVLDLGCGTGQLALPLSRRGCAVWALDPDPDMIAEGVRRQARGGYGPVRWLLGRGEDAGSAGLPSLRLVTMGASFHWTDRHAVLRLLDGLVEPRGGVALVSGAASIFSRSGAVEGAWLEVTREVVEQFLGQRRRAGAGTYAHPPRRHEDMLRDSAFARLEAHRFSIVRRMTADEVIGQQLSTSYASPVLLGEQLDAFRSELARRLYEVDGGAGFETTEHTDLIVARRGQG